MIASLPLGRGDGDVERAVLNARRDTVRLRGDDSVASDNSRTKRAAAADLFDAEQNIDTEKTQNGGAYLQYIVVSVGVGAFLAAVSVSMCLFCDGGCDDGKSSISSGVDGPYVGQIDLADIQVIYNPAAIGGNTPARLPIGTQNEAFKQSHESLVLENPAVLAVPPTLNGGRGAPVRGGGGDIPARGAPGASQGQRVAGRGGQVQGSTNGGQGHLNDVYVENGRIVLAFENQHADDLAVTSSSKVTSTKVTSSSVASSNVRNMNNANAANKTTSANIKRTNELKAGSGGGQVIGGKEYDMNDVTLKNMYVRY